MFMQFPKSLPSLQNAISEVGTLITDDPLLSMGIAFAVGFLIGVILVWRLHRRRFARVGDKVRNLIFVISGSADMLPGNRAKSLCRNVISLYDENGRKHVVKGKDDPVKREIIELERKSTDRK